MTVTEIAVLRLKPGIDVTHSLLKTNLRKAKEAMESNTGYPFYYKQALEDPALIYVLGEWISPEYHWNEWIPSKTNRDLVDVLTPILDIEYMFHLGVEPAKLPFDAPVLAIGRYKVSPEHKAAFEKTFLETKHHVEEFVDYKSMGYGWRIEKEDDGKEEWVLISGWKSKDQHGEFATSEGFKEFAKIREHLESFEVRHLVHLEM
jgi:heme-degrading monooxygenase HmoA